MASKGSRRLARLALYTVLALVLGAAPGWLVALQVEPYPHSWIDTTRDGVSVDWWASRVGVRPTAKKRGIAPVGADIMLVGTSSKKVTPNGSWRVARRMTVGMPFRAFSGEEWATVPSMYDGVSATASQRASMLRFNIGQDVRLIPIRPTLGLAINTLIWIAILFAATFAVRFIRARVRFLDGRCVHCGHEIVCPECGKLARRAGQPHNRR